ncbi:LysR family transcriptional regulator [Paenibacillus sp. FSL R7-0204]|uniref:DNA-binding transcriptional LysR family regulator n=1 Tax=Paenibacillus silagei TaxID=1670801 RepID=A0ABS4NWG4_9BACL|nr:MULTISPECIES: LysR family transcriptional regulator [Paenibacillus]ETT32558.1 LysR family transcriptional regulator [Paenibacillus sp. FSL R7-269]ETT68235.1 LysR family transcriptional regulator [Paenibacillus sp. FSL R7-277]MBP2113769.1 DNA-binding transcriptional LysR family regulator [Paenibacillus silagei]OMF85141.1 LysR family transcriptional regulator [Paenibacillus sp. FSL R7-0337]
MYDDLDAFAAVVEHSSLNRASRQLNLSQPALSRKISKLEERLGVALFNRFGKRLELTEVGRLTYTYALEQRQQRSKFLEALSKFKEGEPQLVTLGASLTTLQTTLPPLVKAYTEKYPAAELKLITGKTHEMVTAVSEGKCDVAIIASQVQEPGLRCIPLFEDQLRLVVSEQHPLTLTPRLTMEHLSRLPMILFSKGTWYRRTTDDLFQRCGVDPDVRMEIDSFEAIVRLLPTIKAAALLPNSYLRPELLNGGGLVSLHIKELEQTQRTTCLIYQSSGGLSTAARCLVQVTEDVFLNSRE